MSLKKAAFSGVIWTFGEMFGGQIINFFVNIVLARKLSPDDYGIIGLIYILIVIGNTLMDTGLSPSLMRTKKLNDIDYSTTFVSQIILSLFIYTIIYIAAPFISIFYDRTELTNIIRVFCLLILLQSTVQVQSLFLIKKFNFRKQTLIKLPSIILSSSIAIYMAYDGYGIWSLVCMYLLQNFFWTLFHWLFGEWKLSLKFDKNVFYKHFNYGYKISLVEILNNITSNIYQIVLGRFYSLKTVGYYTQSLTIYQIPFSNIFSAILKVLFPLFAEIQDNEVKIKYNFLKCQEIFLMLMYPIFVFLFFNAKEILIVIFSEKWKDASFYLQILSFAAFSNIISFWSLQILKLLVDSSKILKYELIMKGILFLIVYICVLGFHNLEYFLLSIPFISLISMIYFSSKVIRLLKIPYYIFYKLIFNYVLIAFLPAIIINYIVMENMLLQLLIKGVLYLVSYFLLLLVFKKELLIEIRTLLYK